MCIVNDLFWCFNVVDIVKAAEHVDEVKRAYADAGVDPFWVAAPVEKRNHVVDENDEKLNLEQKF